jgi:hypothetical protein
MHRTLCQGVEDANGLRSGEPYLIEQNQRPRVLNGLGDDAFCPDYVTA